MFPMANYISILFQDVQKFRAIFPTLDITAQSLFNVAFRLIPRNPLEDISLLMLLQQGLVCGREEENYVLPRYMIGMIEMDWYSTLYFNILLCDHCVLFGF